jgi:hypothetical protein
MIEKLEYIRESVPHEELLAQLAEEATELAQAALKMRRKLDGRNPTPVPLSQAYDNLTEEIADVRLCLRVLGFDPSAPNYNKMEERKLRRWADRLRKARGTDEKTESGLLEE